MADAIFCVCHYFVFRWYANDLMEKVTMKAEVNGEANVDVTNSFSCCINNEGYQ
jgi:hypothetical protein